MSKRSMLALLLGLGLVAGGVGFTRLDDEAARQEAPPTAPPTQADEPVQAPADQKKFPTPAELVRQMRERAAAKDAQSLVAQIDFSAPLSEQPAGASLFGGGGANDLRAVLGRLRKAEADADCKAVLLTFYNGGMLNYAQAQEVRAALADLKKAGKRTFVYADTFDTLSYLVAAEASDVVLMAGGEMFIPGVSIEPMFYRGALDKLGVKPDYVQIGEYKGAEEPYTRTEPSEELAGEMNRLADAMYGQIVDQIAVSRGLRPSDVKGLIDRAMIPAAEAVELGLVDHLADADGLKALMAGALKNEVRVEEAYGVDAQEGFDPNNPFALLALLQPQKVETSGPTIAVIHAEGVINTGESGSGGGLLGGEAGVGSETIRRAMRLAERDENVKAIVIRIDSPGGSALASEAMYQAVRRVAETKPVVVSVGGMAASGGYYLAVAGDHIVADPAAIVGSIGVVGGKLVLGGLYDKLGLSTAAFARGENANLFSDTAEWDPRQKKLVREWMRRTYEQFTDRVMSTRAGKIKDVDQVARGRIFLAKDAKDLGMVDELGGIELALRRAAERANLENYDVVVLPEAQPNPFAGLGLPFLQAPSVEAQAMLKLIPPHVREALGRTVALAELLNERPVVLIAPYVIRVR